MRIRRIGAGAVAPSGRRLWWVVLVGSCLAPALAYGQSAGDQAARDFRFREVIAVIDPNTQIRFGSGGKLTEGRLTGSDRDSVYFITQGIHYGAPWRPIDSLWIRQRAPGRGALIGAIVGAALASSLAVAVMSSASPAEQRTGGGIPGALGVGIAFGGVTGGVAGALVGTAFHRWNRRYP